MRDVGTQASNRGGGVGTWETGVSGSKHPETRLAVSCLGVNNTATVAGTARPPLPQTAPAHWQLPAAAEVAPDPSQQGMWQCELPTACMAGFIPICMPC